MRIRWALVVGLAIPSGAAGQVIQGIALERGSAPVPGVLLLLLDGADRIVARALTDSEGRYRLSPAAAGTYRIRTLRIGYRPLISLPLELAQDQELRQTLQLASVPVSLDTVRVVGRGCRVLSDSAGSVATVWEQARIALAAAQVTAGMRTIRAATLRFERTMDPSAKRLISQTAVADTNYVRRPWRSRSADSLRRFGYTYVEPDKSRTYHAPDLDVLLSTEFIEDHCVRLAASNEERDLIGVAFEPTRERARIPDIRGTLWLDRASSELRRMDFGYVNTGARGIDNAGGDMHFVRMANGAWSISRWNIRMPLLEQRQAPTQGIPGVEPGVELRLRGWRIAGGELSLVMQGRDTLWQAAHAVASAPVASPAQPPSPHPTAPPTTPPVAADSAVGLTSVEVRAGRPMRSEFEERRTGSFGQFLTRAELEKLSSSTLPDILSRLSGLRMTRVDGQSYVTNTRTMTGLRERPQQGRRPPVQACFSDVYIDGIAIYSGRPSETLFDVSTLNPADIEGIEFYASAATTPIKYSRQGATCGTILIWTRHR